MRKLADFITILRIGFAIALLAMYPFSLNRTIFVIFGLLAGVSDLLDGFFARKSNNNSVAGKILDHVADKIYCNTALILLLKVGIVNFYLVALFIIRDFLASACKEILLRKRDSITPVFLSKVKTFLIYSGLIIILYYQKYGLDVLYVSLALAYLTVFYYIANAIDND